MPIYVFIIAFTAAMLFLTDWDEVRAKIKEDTEKCESMGGLASQDVFDNVTCTFPPNAKEANKR